MINKKVIWVVGFSPEKIGSYEEMMLAMAEAFKARGAEISFVFPDEPLQKLKDSLLKAGSKVFIMPTIGRFDLKAIFKLAGLIKKEKIDIVHSNFDRANLCSCFASYLARAPVYIWHQHNFMGSKANVIRRLFLKLLGIMADKVIVITDAMKKNLVSVGLNERKIKIIYNGIKIEKFNFDSKSTADVLKKEFNIDLSFTVLTCIGDARPEKGHIFLLKAFSEINKKFPRSILLLIGAKNGPCYEDLRSETERLKLGSRVIFTEMRSDVPQILSISDIVIVPPTMEVSLYSIMEAMASFKPVIASRVGGIPEVVKDGEAGILIAPSDIEALSKAVEYLISNPLVRDRMGKAGRQAVAERFNIKRDIEQLLMLYEEIMEEKGLV